MDQYIFSQLNEWKNRDTFTQNLNKKYQHFHIFLDENHIPNYQINIYLNENGSGEQRFDWETCYFTWEIKENIYIFIIIFMNVKVKVMMKIELKNSNFDWKRNIVLMMVICIYILFFQMMKNIIQIVNMTMKNISIKEFIVDPFMTKIHKNHILEIYYQKSKLFGNYL